MSSEKSSASSESEIAHPLSGQSWCRLNPERIDGVGPQAERLLDRVRKSARGAVRRHGVQLDAHGVQVRVRPAVPKAGMLDPEGLRHLDRRPGLEVRPERLLRAGGPAHSAAGVVRHRHMHVDVARQSAVVLELGTHEDPG
jgi:hypothetical protein